MLSQHKSYFEQKLKPLARSLNWINPNALTVIGIIPQLLFFYFMGKHQILAATIALAFSAIDILDGMIARMQGHVTAFGGFLDSVLDRVSDFFIIGGFFVADLIDLKAATILLVVTFLISYARSRAELASNNTIRFNYGIIERPERIIFLLIVLLLHLIFPSNHFVEFMVWVLIWLSVVTLGQRFYYAYKKL